MSSVALTVIGTDRPGLVSSLAAVVADHGGNWVDSRLTRLAGQFAGVVLVEVSAADLAGFEAELAAGCEEVGLSLTLRHTDTQPEVGNRIRIEVLGQDRPGIVSQLSKTLAELGVSIEDFQSQTQDAPMGDGILFQAKALITTPPGLAGSAVRGALERLADELMVDLELA